MLHAHKCSDGCTQARVLYTSVDTSTCRGRMTLPPGRCPASPIPRWGHPNTAQCWHSPHPQGSD
eukprot:3710728-Prymnesium_polylepis.1